MALSADTIFEVRTTGADTNGGGFKRGASGTDFSQQDAAQFALTGIASAGSGNTILSATAAASMVGNIAQVISGTNFTVGFFEITSVSVGVSITFSTNNAGASICTGVGASGVINIGGCLATPGMASAAALVSDMGIHVKGGTYTFTSATTNISSGCVSLAVGVSLFGYQTTRNDYGTKPIFIADGVITTFQLVTVGSNGYIANIEANGNSRTSSAGIRLGGAGNGEVFRCTARNCTNGGFSGADPNGRFVLCNTTTCSTVASFSNVGSCYGCVAYLNTFTGFLFAGAGSVVNCISAANSGATSDGFSCTNSVTEFINCTSYGNGRDGWRNVNVNSMFYVNCISYGNTGNGYHTTVTVRQSIANLLNCAAGGNGTNFNASIPAGNQVGSITLSGDPFINAASGNFALNNTSGAGAACRAIGIPGALPGISTTSVHDIGAVQHADPTLPATSDVRDSITYGFSDSLEGTAAIPTADDVLLGIPVGATNGNVTLPTEAEVQEGVAFGPLAELTGTFAGGGGGLNIGRPFRGVGR